MPLEVRRKKGESVRSLVSRFIRAVRRSGILVEAKKKKYFRRPLSKLAKKKAALSREELRKKYEKLEKMGKVQTYKYRNRRL